MPRVNIRIGYFLFALLVLWQGAFAEFNPVRYFKAGGPVMWPILLASILVIAVALERVIVLILLRRKMRPTEFAAFMEKSLRDNPDDKEKAVDDMLAFCKKRGGPVASLLTEGLIKYKECRQARLSMLEAKQWMNLAVEEKGRVEIPILEARLPIIATVANIAPLIGLFGTVIGMIGAFETMAKSAGGAKPDELSGNISVALITTAGGLSVAIPALIIYSYLKNTMEKYILEMEEVSLLMVDNIVDK
jgi:biopolymer transport protein ExbB